MKKYLYALKSYVYFCFISLFKTHGFSFTKANLIFPHCVFDFSTRAKVTFGYKITTRRNTQIAVRNDGILLIGDNTFFNSNCIITCHKYIEIGENCKFGPGCMLFDHDHNTSNQNTIIEKNNFINDKIVIGEGCWFGAGCIILKGTIIEPHCVFGAGTIIKGNYKSNSIVIQKRNTTIKQLNK